MMFESDSEYVRLLLIQTPLSHKLNPKIQEPLLGKMEMDADAVEMTTQRTVEKPVVSVSAKREGKIYERTQKMHDLLLSAVDETINQIFKEDGAKVIYGFIENIWHLRREEIAEKPKDFSVCLEKLLSSAAPVIEKVILVNLSSKLGLEFVEREGFDFADYVMELRERRVDK